MMNDTTSTLTAVGSIATPLLVLALTAAGWRLRSRLERRLSLEDQLRTDRVATYNAILEPFVLLLMTEEAWASDPKNKGREKDRIALRTMLSYEYRQHGFKLSFVGSDGVVRAYNNLVQFFYGREEGQVMTERDTKQLMTVLGTFLLEIRRSMGNEHTKLENWDMLEWWLTDARKLRGSS